MMDRPEVPDLRSGGFLGRLITLGLWLKLVVGVGLVVAGVWSFYEDPRAALLLIAFGFAMALPVVVWLRSE